MQTGFLNDAHVRATRRGWACSRARAALALVVVLTATSVAWAHSAPDDDPEAAGREAIYAQFAMGVYLLERGEAGRSIALLDFAWRESGHDPTVGARLAEAYYAIRDLGTAESVVDGVLKADPDHEEVLQLKARLRYAQRDAAGAIVYLERARAIRTSFETERLLGSLYAESGETEKAIEAFEHCIRIDPSIAFLHAVRGELLLEAGRRDEAEAAFRAGLEIEPQNERVVESLVNLLESEGRLKDAISVLETVARGPDAPEAMRLKLAEAYLEADRAHDGIQLLEAARKDPGLSTEGELMLGRLYYQAERYQDALGVFGPLAQRAGDSPELYRILGELHVKTGEAEKARADFERAIAAAPDDFRNYLALFFAHSEEFSKDDVRVKLSKGEATAILDKASSLAPRSDFDANFMVGMACLSVDSLTTARMHLERADAIQPDDRGVLFNLASVHEKTREFERAEKILIRLHESHPDDAAISNFYGYLLAEMNKQLDLAENLVREALAKEPDNGYYLDSLGWVLYKKGDYRNAARELERAIDKLGEDAVILDHLGDAYAALSRYKDALAAYRHSNRLQDSATVREKIESTERRLD
ncbi:MAG: tetratricopeptide repeat protein [Candidatus Latescibacteria bacterium]|nr:tetratricopeptide repeat protein [Candidatus Latescibacterota bacterium]